MVYAVLLRGVNVGAHGRMKMEDLRQALEGAGLSGVETYIQSGNAVFESDLPESALAPAIRAAIIDRFGFQSEPILRSAAELRDLVRNLPFSPEQIARAEEQNTQGESLYACLLAAPPEAEKLRRMDARTDEGERAAVVGRDAYLLIEKSVRSARLAQAVQKLDPRATMRNWRTILAMLELVERRG